MMLLFFSGLFTIFQIGESFVEIESLESLEFGMIADNRVDKDRVLGVLMFDYIVESFEEDM